ncbi:MAG: CFI-box-CTERM domain-containing protein [Candidatus Methylomirabilales bacterium]
MWRRALVLPVGILLMLAVASAAPAAAPKVTRVELGANVADGFLIVPNGAGMDAGGVGPMSPAKFISPGTSDSALSNNGVTVFTNVFGDGSTNLVQSDADMIGDAGVYGMFLFNITTGAPGATPADRRLADMLKWKIKNANADMFGSAYGPGNIKSISLENAVPAGTAVTVTIDMQGSKPHMIGIFGGAAASATTPKVVYNSTTGILTVRSSTIATKNAGGRGGTDIADPSVGADATDNTLASTFGMTVLTNDADFGNPTAAMKMVAWTNAWPGDIFAYLPGEDASSSKGSGSAGTMGQTTAKFGLTVNGPTGDNRSFHIFVPSGVLPALFGAGITSTDITGYVNGAAATTTSVSDDTIFTADGTGVQGAHLSFSYTFASPTDNSVGVVAAEEGGGDSGLCFIASAVFGSYQAPEVWALREFRYHYLMTNAVGRAFVRLYETVSPPIARFLGQHEWLKTIVRLALMPAVWLSLFMLQASSAAKMLALMAIAALALGFVGYRLRRRTTPA